MPVLGAKPFSGCENTFSGREVRLAVRIHTKNHF
jgi:hypothetical protein